ncbi:MULTISPECIES: DnaA inactivator Hda [Gilliamella]|uniref:DnaA inactivator Hda n=1 Tax=Gilliamella TaxID=1193503 RepID=UPI00080F3DE5|nr:DnaA inactivator Hda [Gilliamella sp. W8126]MBI0038740.1 DnaA inactivator Hda [Gilliamella sp. B14384G10]MBI0040991.1 DnaA inactivator Hda [Gilliamella sp. B14384G7]MBI0052690.1 DnaA inactivator Hda [Gilliamella sp. B14384G13]MBI0055027.1 DnaA inactivator Hda [Gilliamella sp. B14384H2]MBI0104303.1 DnaA inactivator Hda [Gilliamella sp. W8145]OCF94776.1 DnaA regulatory inactivator Hda [Gilliamella apis]OTQ58480.1 DnaA regulatory inactivator Hda [Gilliamella sp. A7]
MTLSQLPLPFILPNNETFDSFYVGDNQLLFDSLQTLLDREGFNVFYIWSASAAGRTHLLHASSQNKLASYIPLKQHVLLVPEILQGLDNYDLVCLDDIDAIAGHRDWEEAIFDLFNRLTEKNVSKLLITACAPPKQIPFILPDLASRLTWGQVYQLKELSDEDKLKALQLRAQLSGFELSTEVGLFLLKRVNRDMRTLFSLMEKFEVATLAQQRKLTIPFIKNILDL